MGYYGIEEATRYCWSSMSPNERIRTVRGMPGPLGAGPENGFYTA